MLPRPNVSEIEALRWISADELDAELAQDGHTLTPWLAIEWKRLRSEFKDELGSGCEMTTTVIDDFALLVPTKPVGLSKPMPLSTRCSLTMLTARKKQQHPRCHLSREPRQRYLVKRCASWLKRSLSTFSKSIDSA